MNDLDFLTDIAGVDPSAVQHSETVNTSPLVALGKQFAEVRRARLDLDKESKRIKETELELQNELLNSMNASGISEFNIDGTATLKRITKYFYEIVQEEVLYRVILTRALECIKTGQPLVNAFSLLSRSVSKSSIDALIENNEVASLESIGLKQTETYSINANKAK